MEFDKVCYYTFVMRSNLFNSLAILSPFHLISEILCSPDDWCNVNMYWANETLASSSTKSGKYMGKWLRKVGSQLWRRQKKMVVQNLAMISSCAPGELLKLKYSLWKSDTSMKKLMQIFCHEILLRVATGPAHARDRRLCFRKRSFIHVAAVRSSGVA